LPAQKWHKVSHQQAWDEGKAHAHIMADGDGCEPLEFGAHGIRVVVADPKGRPLSDGAPTSDLVFHAPQLRPDHGAAYRTKLASRRVHAGRLLNHAPVLSRSPSRFELFA
jgi:hypothetical protein